MRSPRSQAQLQRRRGVRRRADDAAVLAAERFDRRGGVDVGDRDDAVDTPHLLEIAPAHLELLDVGHVGHRAAGGEVRQDHLLVVGAQHVGALGHEVHAAEDDELGVGMPADLPRELERVAGVVGELDHLVALIVMAEDDQPAAERRLGGGDADVHLLVGQAEIPLRQRLALGDVLLLVGRQDWKQHGSCLLVKLFAIVGTRKSQALGQIRRTTLGSP